MRRTVVVAAGLVLATMVGCGEDRPPGEYGLDLGATEPEAVAGPASDDPVDIARWEYAKAADEICEASDPVLEQVLADLEGSGPTPTGAATVHDAMTSIADELAALPPPRGDEAVVADLSGGFRHLGSLFARLYAAYEQEDHQQIEAVRAELDAAAHVIELRFQSYGITACV